MLESVNGVTEAQHNTMQIFKSWVLNLDVGNGPTDEAWFEISKSNNRLPDDNADAMRTLLLDLMNEMDHGTN